MEISCLCIQACLSSCQSQREITNGQVKEPCTAAQDQQCPLYALPTFLDLLAAVKNIWTAVEV